MADQQFFSPTGQVGVFADDIPSAIANAQDHAEGTGATSIDAITTPAVTVTASPLPDPKDLLTFLVIGFVAWMVLGG